MGEMARQVIQTGTEKGLYFRQEVSTKGKARTEIRA